MLVDDDLKVVSQHERYPLSPNTKLHLEVAQEVPKVNMEQLSAVGDHDVVGVAVPYAEDISGHTVACTGETERLGCLL